MTKGKRIEIQTMIYKTLQRKLKVEQYQTHYKNRGEFRYPDRVSSYFSTGGTVTFLSLQTW